MQTRRQLIKFFFLGGGGVGKQRPYLLKNRKFARVATENSTTAFKCPTEVKMVNQGCLES